MGPWQADRLAALHHRDLEAAAQGRNPRQRRPREGDAARRPFGYRLGLLLIAVGGRLTHATERTHSTHRAVT